MEDVQTLLISRNVFLNKMLKSKGETLPKRILKLPMNITKVYWSSSVYSLLVHDRNTDSLDTTTWRGTVVTSCGYGNKS